MGLLGGERAVMASDVHGKRGLIRSYEILGLMEFRPLDGDEVVRTWWRVVVMVCWDS